MKHIVSLADAPAALEAYWPSRTTLHRMSLDYMREFMAYLGNPQDSLKVIHVAGTSGKTSTAYYAAALLKAAGHTVGLTVSPHVDTLNERVQIGLEPLPEAAFVAEMNLFMQLVEAGPLRPTYFELLYAFAFWEFARRGVAYAVVEVGVGGLLDNTNVISRADKVCVITDIGYDHMSILGNTLPEIASQKAGIIQLHNAVFCWKQSKEIMAVIRHAAAQKQADLHTLTTAALDESYHFLPLFQRRNFELARAAVGFTLERDGYALPGSVGQRHAAHTPIPARMQVVMHGGKTIILDGSHNAQKLHALVESVQAQYPGQAVAVLAAYAKSKTPESRIEGGTHELIQLASFMLLTSFVIDRLTPHHSVDPQDIAKVCAAAGFRNYEVIPDPAEAFQAILKRPEPVIVVAGSFFLLNAVRPLVGLTRPESRR